MNYKDYSPDWRDIIRPAILKRDSYKCAVCGIKHKSRVYKSSRGEYVILDSFSEQWAKANGKKVFTLFLNVAHLDQDKQNNSPSNLLSLCPRDHTNYDKRYRIDSRKVLKVKSMDDNTQSVLSSINLSKTEIDSFINSVYRYTGYKITNDQARQIVNSFYILPEF